MTSGQCWLTTRQGRKRSALITATLPQPLTRAEWAHWPHSPHHSLALNLGQPDPGKRSDGRTQRWPGDLGHCRCLLKTALWMQPRLLMTVQPLQSLQPKHHDCQASPTHPAPQPYTRAETTARVKTSLIWFWAGLQMLTQAAIDSASTPTLLTSALPSFGGEVAGWRERKIHTWREQTQLQPDAQGFHTRSLRADRKSLLTPCTVSGSSNTSHTHYQGDSSQHILRKDRGWHSHQVQPSHQKQHTLSTQGCSHIKTPLQDHNM